MTLNYGNEGKNIIVGFWANIQKFKPQVQLGIYLVQSVKGFDFLFFKPTKLGKIKNRGSQNTSQTQLNTK